MEKINQPCGILVTPRSISRQGHPLLGKLSDMGFQLIIPTPGRQPQESEILNSIPDCAAYIAGVEPISSRILENAPHLRMISRNGAGMDNVDLAAAKSLGILVMSAPGANARGVAELTLGHILCSVRNIPDSHAQMKEKKWQRQEGIELENRTLGIVGCGIIGKMVTQLALGFGMKVLAYDPFPDSTYQPSSSFSFCPLPELLKNSDIISLHCPAHPDGAPLIGRNELSMMKPGSRLINTARASLIDPKAAYEFLEKGALAGLTLDAYEMEPPQDFKLIKHPRVIATPHIGAYTAESVERASRTAIQNVIDQLPGLIKSKVTVSNTVS